MIIKNTCSPRQIRNKGLGRTAVGEETWMGKEDIQAFKSAATDVWIGPSAPFGPSGLGAEFWSVLLLQQDGCQMGWISCSLAGHLSQCLHPSHNPALLLSSPLSWQGRSVNLGLQNQAVREGKGTWKPHRRQWRCPITKGASPNCHGLGGDLG